MYYCAIGGMDLKIAAASVEHWAFHACKSLSQVLYSTTGAFEKLVFTKAKLHYKVLINPFWAMICGNKKQRPMRCALSDFSGDCSIFSSIIWIATKILGVSTVKCVLWASGE
uniref:Uncharacterized protein n=1 Tax=Romanomermis culicivorax TaxID=13658 RepID=A0A915KXX7_ROMCU